MELFPILRLLGDTPVDFKVREHRAYYRPALCPEGDSDRMRILLGIGVLILGAAILVPLNNVYKEHGYPWLANITSWSHWELVGLRLAPIIALILLFGLVLWLMFRHKEEE